MKKTFVCDESMIITIPIGSVKSARVGQLMPERFQCVYKDSFKIFVLNGKPKPLGVSSVVFFTQVDSNHKFVFVALYYKQKKQHCNEIFFCLFFIYYDLLGSPSHCWSVHCDSWPDLLSDWRSVLQRMVQHQKLHSTLCCGKYKCKTKI